MANKQTSLTEKLLIFLRGMLMGIADVIPGVSGGTIALITGIYPRLIHSISTIDLSFVTQFFMWDFKQSWKTFKKIDFGLFIPLAIGIGTAILLASRIIDNLLTQFPASTYAFFFGLILASAIFLLKTTGKLTYERAIFIVLGFILAYVLAGSFSLVASHSHLMTFFSGAVAICAMLLPGISGAFILLLLGQYQYILNALHTFSLPTIGVFSLGALTGLLLFSKVIDYFLRHFKTLTFSFLVGLMLGSLRIPITEISQSNSFSLLALLFGTLGFIIVFALENIFGQK